MFDCFFPNGGKLRITAHVHFLQFVKLYFALFR